MRRLLLKSRFQWANCHHVLTEGVALAPMNRHVGIDERPNPDCSFRARSRLRGDLQQAVYGQSINFDSSVITKAFIGTDLQP
jgi:hypothetical protein